MIDRREIDEAAAEIKVHSSNVQRDYVFGWLLNGIYGYSNLADKLVLKGGNAFRKAYFPNARFSPDLDFALATSQSSDFLLAELNNICNFVTSKAKVVFDIERSRIDDVVSVDRDRTIHKVRLYFNDFYGSQNEIYLAVRMDLSEFEKIYLPIQESKIQHAYSDSEELKANIRCLKLEELLASKLKCLIQRRHSADLYDFVNATLFSPVININRKEMVETFLRMTIFGSGPRIVENLLVNLPFEAFKFLWQKTLIIPAGSENDYDKAVDGFRGIVSELFGDLPVGSSQYAFFPAEFRNPIMQAAQESTLLKVRYKGGERLVEPYSLMYKRRQDGITREYFYVYDTTGGGSPPGIKALVYSNVNSMENTNIKYEPRLEVELTKAGQIFGDTYFKGSQGRRIWRSTFQQYTVECPYCRKRFKRSKYSTALNPHKDQWGNSCSGRIGYITYGL